MQYLRWPGGMEGSRSVRGVVQLMPGDLRVALVIRVLSRAVNAQRNCPWSVGRWSIASSNCDKTKQGSMFVRHGGVEGEREGRGS